MLPGRSLKCRVVHGRDGAGREGLFYGEVVVQTPRGQKWSVVVWEGDEEPTVFESSGLEVERTVWQSLSQLQSLERHIPK